MVTGPDRDYFWLLARTLTIDPDLQKELIGQAKNLGFSFDKLMITEPAAPFASMSHEV